MKKLLLLLTLSIFSLTACDCTTTRYYPSGDTAVASAGDMRSAPRQGRRNHNKKLMSHIADRTVAIKVDCTPKDGVVVVGANSKRYGDGSGTGIIVRSEKGKSYLFTAAHVVEMPRKGDGKHFTCVIKIQPASDVGTTKNIHTASIVVSSTNHDVAVLSVDTDLGFNTELELDPFTGEDVWAAGFPRLLVAPSENILSITKGTLATKNIPMRGNSRRNGFWHRVTTQVYFGNSGGGLWSKSGKLVAIVSALVSGDDGDPIEGNYLVKPVQEVLDLLNKKGKYDQVITGGK